MSNSHQHVASQTFCQTPLARQCRPKTTLRDAREGQTPESQASTPATGGVVRPVNCTAFNRRHRDIANHTFCRTPLARQCRPKTTLRDARGGQTPESQASTPATGGVVRPEN